MMMIEETAADYPMMAPCVKVTRSDLRREVLRFPNYETGEIGFQLAFPTSLGGKYDQVS